MLQYLSCTTTDATLPCAMSCLRTAKRKVRRIGNIQYGYIEEKSCYMEPDSTLRARVTDLVKSILAPSPSTSLSGVSEGKSRGNTQIESFQKIKRIGWMVRSKT